MMSFLSLSTVALKEEAIFSDSETTSFDFPRQYCFIF